MIHTAHSMSTVTARSSRASSSGLVPVCPTNLAHHPRHRCNRCLLQSHYSTDAITAAVYEEDEYEKTKQAEFRKAWAANVRSATGRKHHIIWQPELDPPPLLADVCVVLVGPKKPISCGTVARACSCFECEDLRVVQARCDHNTRSSRSVSKGAQYIIHRAQVHDTLSDALADVDLSVAFTRWLPEQQHRSLPDIPSLLAHPVVQHMLRQPQGTGSSSSSKGQVEQQQQQQQHDALGQLEQQQLRHTCLSQLDQQRPMQVDQQPDHASSNGSLLSSSSHGKGPMRIGLVFGREEFGLSDEEVAACDISCAISIGRLQESLSLSHAASIVLAQIYQARLSALAAAADAPAAGLAYTVSSVDELAEGYDSSAGVEH